jgi:hypothetical protein
MIFVIDLGILVIPSHSFESSCELVRMDVREAITVIAVFNAFGPVEGHSKVKTNAENICKSS